MIHDFRQDGAHVLRVAHHRADSPYDEIGSSPESARQAVIALAIQSVGQLLESETRMACFLIPKSINTQPKMLIVARYPLFCPVSRWAFASAGNGVQSSLVRQQQQQQSSLTSSLASASASNGSNSVPGRATLSPRQLQSTTPFSTHFPSLGAGNEWLIWLRKVHSGRLHHRNLGAWCDWL